MRQGVAPWRSGRGRGSSWLKATGANKRWFGSARAHAHRDRSRPELLQRYTPEELEGQAALPEERSKITISARTVPTLSQPSRCRALALRPVG